MNLEDHIRVIRNIPLTYKADLIRFLWATFKEHSLEIETEGGIKTFLNKIYTKAGQNK